MIFRFTPVIMLFFLLALVSVSGFMLWNSYQNAQEVLHIEQEEQVNQTHELAEQFLQYHLSEDIRTIELFTALSRNTEHDGLNLDLLEKSKVSYIVKFKTDSSGKLQLSEHVGQMSDESAYPLRRNHRWSVEQTSNGIALAYQFPRNDFGPDNQPDFQLYKAGIYLNGNSPLLSQMRESSHAHAHVLLYNNEVLASSVSIEDGVFETVDTIIQTQQPVYASPGSLYSGDMIPLRFTNKDKPLFLVSVNLTEGTEKWAMSFNNSTILSVQFIFLAVLLVTFLIRQFTKRSLDNLLSYAENVRVGEGKVDYKTGIIKEFNELGTTLEAVVRDLSVKSNYISGMVDAANSPIISWDKDGKIAIFNKSAERIFGEKCTPPQIDTIYAFFKTHNAFNALEACHQAALGQDTNNLETKFLIDGSEKYIIWSIAPLFDEESNVTGAIAQGQDITDRRQVEKRLQLSSKVFDSTAEAIMITDDKGDIVDVNSAFTDITGYERQEVIGRNPRVMKSGRHSGEFYKRMWNSLVEHGIWRGEIWDRRKNGEEFPKWLSISASRNENGRLMNYVAVFSDITGKKEDEQKLEKLAHFDPLTELPNRTLFHDRLYTAVARSRRDKELMAVLFVDLDKFKQVNDSLGHRVGDLLLKEVAKRLQHSVREIDTVARLSGDEFTVILTDIISEDDVEMIATRIVKSVGAPYFFEGHELFVSASVGIAIYPTDGDNTSDLLRNADVAMYHAKEKGRNNYQFFNDSMNDQVQNQLSLANQLRIAINRKLIIPHYQLKVDCITGVPTGVEALARWSDEHGKPISPGVFIPVAEEHGLVVKIGHSILNQACVQARMWQDMKFDFGSIAINLSAQQFRDKNLLGDIKKAIEDNRIDPSMLEVEVTENMMMDDVEQAIQILNNIKEMGLKISIDDFGTGYSSLNYLKRFPVDTLKIDRSFVYELTPDSDDATIVSAIVSLAQKLKIDVVAEGVETIEQLEFLKSIGCNIVQGFYFAKPCSGGELPLIWSEVIEKHK